MKIRKAISMSIVVMLLLTSMATPVYAGGLIDLFAKKKINPPSEFDYYWNGDYVELNWEQVEGGGYEIAYDGKMYKVPAGHNWFDIKPTEAQIQSGIVDGNITVSTLPADKKSKQSDPINMPFSLFTVSTSDILDDAGLACLSKEKSTELFKSLGYSVETFEDDDYSIVSFTKKDENYQGLNYLKNGVKEVAGGFIQGAGDGVYNNKEEIVKYALENGDGVKDTIKKGKEAYGEYANQGAKEGAIGALLKYAFKDKNIHYTFYYPKGMEIRTPEFFIHDYFVSNNESPKDIFENFGYDYIDSADSYLTTPAFFNRSVLVQYESRGEAKEKRWFITYIPIRLY